MSPFRVDTVEVTSTRDRVVDHVRRLIEKGDLKPGDRLPGERDLAVELGLSRPSVRSGLEALESMGIVVSRRGAGTFIADGPPDLGREPLQPPRLPARLLDRTRCSRRAWCWRSASRTSPP